MTSIIDALIEERIGKPDWIARYAGIRFAQAGTRQWQRGPQENELDFLDRVRAEARAAGFATLFVRGWIRV
jgi:hypothetical protein